MNHWDGLTRFLDDGRVELDINIRRARDQADRAQSQERLFAGHDEGADNWALIASLIETCKLNDVDPQAYFASSTSDPPPIDELMLWA